MKRVVFIAAVLAFGGAFVSAQAQAPESAPKSAPSPTKVELQPTVSQSMATIETIIEVAVRNIAARYNLNEEQTRETDTLMKREVYRFLKEHESQVWPAIRDLLSSQLGAKPPSDPNELKRIGGAAAPLAKLAEEAIFRANEEWRTFLTPEQQKVHDFDLAEMKKNFQQIHQNFDSWAQGKVVEAPLFPQQQVPGGPPTPPKPREGVPIQESFSDSHFDTYVEDFIKKYDLDQGQIDSARSILKETKEKTADFRKVNKNAFARLTATLREAIAARDTEKKAKVEKERQELLKPVHELFAQMDTRLVGLLNSAQLERYNEDQRDLPDKTAKAPSPKEVTPVKTTERGAEVTPDSGEPPEPQSSERTP